MFRKTRRFIDEPGHAHFFTFSCARRLPLLKSEHARNWLADSLNRVRQKQRVALWAYVFMPEHVHLLLKPLGSDVEMNKVSAAIKFPVARQAHKHLAATGRVDWIQKLTVKKGAREVFQFWQPGTGYDENLENARSLREVIDYIHANPVRRGLTERPTDWLWSSARAHAGVETGPIALDPIDWS
jgi:putative transposase